jgi:hypothetical protein
MATSHEGDCTADSQQQQQQQQQAASSSQQFCLQRQQCVDDVSHELTTSFPDESSTFSAESAFHQQTEPLRNAGVSFSSERNILMTSSVGATTTATAERRRRRDRLSFARSNGQATVGGRKKWQAFMIANYKHSLVTVYCFSCCKQRIYSRIWFGSKALF